MLPTQEYPGLLIAVARRRIKQAVLARAAHRGISPQQFWLLVGLRERRATSQTELAERLHVDAPTASRVLATLVRRRLVRMEEDPADRRRARVRLTRAGEELAGELAGIAGEIRTAMVEGMSAAELDGLRRGLHKIISNLERLEARAAKEAS
ncbi:MAG TPA: MarR family transcriptional regulator [Anaeromyxobacter sp.]